MTTLPGTPRKRYSLFVLAIVLLALGALAIAFSGYNFLINAFGLLMILAAVRLVRASNVHAQTMPTGPARDPNARRVGPLAWVFGVVSLFAVGASYYLLHLDAVDGGHQGWPVYLFSAAVLFCAAALGYLAAKFAS